jgi:hypothetical protein
LHRPIRTYPSEIADFRFQNNDLFMSRVFRDSVIEHVDLVPGTFQQLVEQISGSQQHSGDIATGIVPLRRFDNLVDVMSAQVRGKPTDVADAFHETLCCSRGLGEERSAANARVASILVKHVADAGVASRTKRSALSKSKLSGELYMEKHLIR